MFSILASLPDGNGMIRRTLQHIIWGWGSHSRAKLWYVRYVVDSGQVGFGKNLGKADILGAAIAY